MSKNTVAGLAAKLASLQRGLADMVDVLRVCADMVADLQADAQAVTVQLAGLVDVPTPTPEVADFRSVMGREPYHATDLEAFQGDPDACQESPYKVGCCQCGNGPPGTPTGCKCGVDFQVVMGRYPYTPGELEAFRCDPYAAKETAKDDPDARAVCLACGCGAPGAGCECGTVRVLLCGGCGHTTDKLSADGACPSCAVKVTAALETDAKAPVTVPEPQCATCKGPLATGRAMAGLVDCKACAAKAPVVPQDVPKAPQVVSAPVEAQKPVASPPAAPVTVVPAPTLTVVVPPTTLPVTAQQAWEGKVDNMAYRDVQKACTARKLGGKGSAVDLKAKLKKAGPPVLVGPTVAVLAANGCAVVPAGSGVLVPLPKSVAPAVVCTTPVATVGATQDTKFAALGKAPAAPLVCDAGGRCVYPPLSEDGFMAAWDCGEGYMEVVKRLPQSAALAGEVVQLQHNVKKLLAFAKLHGAVV